MTSTVTSPPTLRGLLDDLFAGRLRWDLLRPFPVQDPRDQQIGDAAVARLRKLLSEHLDPAIVWETRRLPDGLIDLLRQEGYLNMMVGPDLGGLDLSPMNTMRALEAAAALCPAIAMVLGTNSGFGAGNYLPLLADGPLRDLLVKHLLARSVFGTADTEPRGAASDGRDTTAVLLDGGASYLLSGDKVFIGNARVAGLLDVSATVMRDGVEQVRIFFVETSSPGVRVLDVDFMGLHGAPFALVRFDQVEVPAEQLMPSAADLWRDDPGLVKLAVLGRMLTPGPTSLATVKLCLAWSRDFANRRAIDDRPLREYQEIQRCLAQTAADVFAIESVTEWVMLSDDLAEMAPEMTAAKNLLTVTCWQVMDRTLSLFAAEGYESVPSKVRRGAPQEPLERYVSDARGLRISGGVDFLLYIWTAMAAIETIYREPEGSAGESAAPVTDRALSTRCQDHLAHLQAQAVSLARQSERLVRRRGVDALAEDEHELMLAGRIGTTLLGMAVVLARAAHLSEHGAGEHGAVEHGAGEHGAVEHGAVAMDLADIWCTQARYELAGLWPQLDGRTEPDYAATSARLLYGDSLDFLFDDAIIDRHGREDTDA
jgi:alkylation response protein AidB-like acyl-CoA dehydrogenase